MPVVLVNGNPETAAIWDLLVAELRRADTVRVSPPGFGAPVAGGTDCTIRGSRSAARAGAGIEILGGVGHGWMVQAPAPAARAPEHFRTAAG